MGRYDDAADEAQDLTDKELAGKLSVMDFDAGKLRKIFEDGADRQAIEAYIKAVKGAADVETKKLAVQQLGIKIGLKGLRLIVKAVTGGVVALLLFVGTAAAEQFDISTFLNKTGPCAVITTKGDTLAGACYEGLSWKWGGAHVGGVWDTNEAGQSSDKKFKGAFAAVGARADAAFAWAWRALEAEKRGVRVNFVVPRVQFGPQFGYVQDLGWIGGGFLNAQWPFGAAK